MLFVQRVPRILEERDDERAKDGVEEDARRQMLEWKGRSGFYARLVTILQKLNRSTGSRKGLKREEADRD